MFSSTYVANLLVKLIKILTHRPIEFGDFSHKKCVEVVYDSEISKSVNFRRNSDTWIVKVKASAASENFVDAIFTETNDHRWRSPCTRIHTLSLMDKWINIFKIKCNRILF